MNKIETLKGVIMALGLDPNEVLSREAMLKPHRTIIDPLQRQEQDYNILLKIIRETLFDELRSSRYLSMDRSSPVDIILFKSPSDNSLDRTFSGYQFTLNHPPNSSDRISH